MVKGVIKKRLTYNGLITLILSSLVINNFKLVRYVELQSSSRLGPTRLGHGLNRSDQRA